MSVTFAAKNVVQKGDSLQLQIHVVNNEIVMSPIPTTWVSPEILINSVVIFQTKHIKYEDKLLYFLKLSKKRTNDILNYAFKYSHKYVGPHAQVQNEQYFFVVDDSWQLVGEYRASGIIFHVTLEVTTSIQRNPCTNIYDDTVLADFELRGVDGSVPMHKAVAAACSPVLKNEFTGDWGNAAKRVIEAPSGTTKETLQHLKDYMYLSKLPTTGIDQLLLLASFYKVTDLERLCAHQMLTDATQEQAYHFYELGMKRQTSQLLFEIMYRVEHGVLKVAEIQKNQF